MRIFFYCLVILILFLGCTTPTPTASVRGVTVVPRSPVPTETEAIVPSPSANPVRATCPDAPSSRLIVQERGRSTADTTDPINLRNGPSTSYNVVTRIETGEFFFVLDGPSCADGYAWFYVRYRRGNREYLGWLAEGSFENYFVEPYLQG
jgi:uncharacterized protein YgiM (DUF1202 family)